MIIGRDNQSRRIDVVGLSELIDPPSAPQKEAFDQVGVATATHLDVGGGSITRAAIPGNRSR